MSRGRGPAPKDPSTRQRRNKDAVAWQIVPVTAAAQPTLDDVIGPISPATDKPWNPGTLRFWRELAHFPTTKLLVEAQWSLLALAMIHLDAVLAGDLVRAKDLRSDLAKFGIAPDDVARMRVTFATATVMESAAEQTRTKTPRRVPAAKDPRRILRAVN